MKVGSSKNPYNKDAPLARLGDCALYPALGERSVRGKGTRHTYWGVCRRAGLEQMQRFDGYYDVVQRQFAHWVDGIPKTMSIRPVAKAAGPKPKTEKERDMGNEQGTKQEAAAGRALPDRLFAVAYKRGTAVRYVMAFESDDEALDAAEVSGKALEVAGVDGEYTVDELPVRWRRAQ